MPVEDGPGADRKQERCGFRGPEHRLDLGFHYAEYLIGGDIFEYLGLAGRPGDFDARLRGLAKAEVEPWIMAGEVASAGLPFQYLSDLVGYHRYPCSESVGVRSAHEQDL